MASEMVATQEENELALLEGQRRLLSLSSEPDLTPETIEVIMKKQSEFTSLQELIKTSRQRTSEILKHAIKNPPQPKRGA